MNRDYLETSVTIQRLKNRTKPVKTTTITTTQVWKLSMSTCVDQVYSSKIVHIYNWQHILQFRCCCIHELLVFQFQAEKYPNFHHHQEYQINNGAFIIQKWDFMYQWQWHRGRDRTTRIPQMTTQLSFKQKRPHINPVYPPIPWTWMKVKDGRSSWLLGQWHRTAAPVELWTTNLLLWTLVPSHVQFVKMH